MARKQRTWVIPAAVQGTVLFVVGLALLVHECTLPAAEVSWPRLVVFAGMMGGPFAAHADTVRAVKGRIQSSADGTEQGNP